METLRAHEVQLRLRGRKRAWRGLAVVGLAAALTLSAVTSGAQAQKKKPKKKKKGSSLKIDSAMNFMPTRSFAKGTVGSYFFPNRLGAGWTLRTVRTILSDSGKVLKADTIYYHQVVTDTAHFSLQRLPLTVLRDETYGPAKADTTLAESFFYVDDSLAMTVFNNSITQRQNRIFLVSPLEIGNHWHDTYDDTNITVIVGKVDSLITPVGRFDSVIVTLSRKEYSDFRKFFAPGYGIVKSIFRSPGPKGHGLFIITTDMIECTIPGEPKESLKTKE